jgi:glucose-1-phosphate cytidylyltransferase
MQMKVVILCGGKGSRLRSANDNTPKSLALVNGYPIIWHIMKLYSSYGYNDFVLPLGFGGDKIKEFFWNYEWKYNDFIKDMSSNKVTMLGSPDKWTITFINTGIETMTGARIKKIEKYIDDDTFMLTYGDGLSDINIGNLVKYHEKKRKNCHRYRHLTKQSIRNSNC